MIYIIFEDLSNKKYGRLTVVKRIDDYISPKGYHLAQWECLCDCGNTILTTTNKLKTGHTKSCGCFRKDVVYNNLPCKEKNRYEIIDDYVIMYTHKDEPFYIDLEDYDNIKDICWFKNRNGYIVGRKQKKYIQLHRYIMNCSDDMVVDHIGGINTINDNRKTNLRITNCSQNNMNRKLFSNNTSGYTGVAFNKITQKWYAYINYNNNRINLGMFDNINDAIKVRKRAEEKYFGKYSYQKGQKMYQSIRSD